MLGIRQIEMGSVESAGYFSGYYYHYLSSSGSESLRLLRVWQQLLPFLPRIFYRHDRNTFDVRYRAIYAFQSTPFAKSLQPG